MIIAASDTLVRVVGHTEKRRQKTSLKDTLIDNYFQYALSDYFSCGYSDRLTVLYQGCNRHILSVYFFVMLNALD
ncbi:MAG: hypothetical protein AAFQ80_20315 [Cyanobacteria bacterium J06621_8]